MPFSSLGAYQAHLTPRPTQQLFNDNYLSFDSASGGGTFAQQFLPEIYEKEVERFGKRTISGFLSMVGAEMPLASDQVIWSEQGRLHIAYSAETYNDGTSAVEVKVAANNTITLPANNLIQNHDTIVIANLPNSKVLKAIVVSGGGTTEITVAPYTQAHLAAAPDSGSTNGAVDFSNNEDVNIFVYGTEYIKGSSEDGASGYLWYLKSESEARLRFNDYLEMAMIEGQQVEMPAGHNFGGTSAFAVGGTEGLFSALESRGLVWTGTDFDQLSGNVQGGLAEFDTILQELDKQGAIEENMMFLDRGTSLEIDNMLASINSGNVASGGSGYGVFNNDADMALNLGFTGFRRGSYDFYKTDWKYLNDSVTRGLIGDIEGVIVPAGTSTVYDESMGKNIQRPFLHVRYRASEADDRKMKSWITGSVGGNYTSSADEMVVNFLSERCLCVQAANNFVLLKA